MQYQEAVKQHDYDRPNQNWRDEMTILDKYEKAKPEFLKLLVALEDTCDGHPWRLTTARHRIELTHNDVRRVLVVA